MKKSIIIFCTVFASFILTAFGYKNWNTATAAVIEETSHESSIDFNPFIQFPTCQQPKIDLYYNIDSRFIATITKENLRNAKSIVDLVPKNSTNGLSSFRDIRITILSQDGKRFENGTSKALNSAQLKLLKTADYSTDFCIEAFCKRKNPYVGIDEDQCFVYYVTIVPEKEAEYKEGHSALLDYLRENSKEKTAIIQKDLLKPGKVSFTVTKNGTIANTKVTSTSGYSSVDEALVKLISSMPEKWNPARNSKGEKIDQELIFFFGLQGC